MGIPERLEYLRRELRAERASYGELAELQGLRAHIQADDTELLEAAGVPEFPPCAIAMGCLCAAHALGAPSDAPCNADEKSAFEEWGQYEQEWNIEDPDYDPTPYETGEPDNLPREAQERAQEDLKFKR